ncbi:unnamed protein product [Protopolystoma xenopodis]|uniref:Uncharacterized protein n=1 Tax=Protopolystoma xenopodis TaxID=117903 RepID=A0A3S5CN32_9PLAT|nr:unnamed protein product [Protopolystoma xenopodis]
MRTEGVHVMGTDTESFVRTRVGQVSIRFLPCFLCRLTMVSEAWLQRDGDVFEAPIRHHPLESSPRNRSVWCSRSASAASLKCGRRGRGLSVGGNLPAAFRLLNKLLLLLPHI